jgi:hypothetical protein
MIDLRFFQSQGNRIIRQINTPRSGSDHQLPIGDSFEKNRLFPICVHHGQVALGCV